MDPDLYNAAIASNANRAAHEAQTNLTLRLMVQHMVLDHRLAPQVVADRLGMKVKEIKAILE